MEAKVDQEIDKGNSVRDHPIIVALIGAGGLVLAALIPVVIVLHGGSTPASSGPANSPAPNHVSAPSDPSGGSPALTNSAVLIFSPENGARLRGDESVLVDGSAMHLGQESLWIFVRRYGIYYVSDINSIAVANGRWRFRDPYIGSGSNPGSFQINAVLANASCALTIHSAKQQPGGGVAFKSLPRGCRILDTVDVERV